MLATTVPADEAVLIVCKHRPIISKAVQRSKISAAVQRPKISTAVQRQKICTAVLIIQTTTV